MAKRINELSKEEIASLFPVELSQPLKGWKNIFLEEQKLIKAIPGDIALGIEHFEVLPYLIDRKRHNRHPG